MFYHCSQWWDKNTIHSYQDARLRRIITHAADHVPYYRRLFKDIGLDVTRFKGREDMHKIPLLDKETLRRHQDEFIADNAERFGIHWDSTSGSTGKPLHLIVDNRTKAHKLAAVIRSYRWAGYFPWKKAFSIQSYQLDGPDHLFKHYKGVNLWRFDAKRLTRESALKIVKMINRIRPKIFIGYPFSLLMIARFAAEEGVSIRPVPSIVTAGETLSPQRRQFLESHFGCRVYDFYSHHENAAIVTECSHGTKHICEDFGYNEVVDENGAPLQQGVGRFVGTGFYNFAMPLIRYQTGDTVILPDSDLPCPCGRKHRRVEEIIGRQNDYIETPDGRFIGNVLEHSVDHSHGVVVSQCVQDALDHLYVNLVVDETFSESSTKALEKGLRKRLGEDIRIDFKVVEHLEKNKSGKTPFIMSKMGHEYV